MNLLSQIGDVLSSLWWVWLTVISGWMFFSVWMAWRQALFKANIVWNILEIKIPREAKRSIKAMEHILMNMWALRNSPGNLKEWYWDGESVLWFSLEIASFGGDIHFYVRIPSKYTNIVKANFYGQYPECEVSEVSDYIDRFPKTVPEIYQSGFNIFGFEMSLGKNNAYPIRTYEYFEDMEENRNLDPLAPIFEIMAKMSGSEVMMMHIVARPSTDPRALVKLADAEIEVLKEKFGKKSGGLAEGEFSSLTSRTPGETEVLKMIDEKAGKNAFEVVVRSIYLAPKENFSSTSAYRGIRNSYQQFGMPSGNFFDVNYRTWTLANIWDPPHIFPKRVQAGRRARLWDMFRKRSLPISSFTGKIAQFHIFTSTFTQKMSLLNTEEVATLWHLPTEAILTGPLIEKIEAKKMGPPPGLPIFMEGNHEIPSIMK